LARKRSTPGPPMPPGDASPRPDWSPVPTGLDAAQLLGTGNKSTDTLCSSVANCTQRLERGPDPRHPGPHAGTDLPGPTPTRRPWTPDASSTRRPTPGGRPSWLWFQHPTATESATSDKHRPCNLDDRHPGRWTGPAGLPLRHRPGVQRPRQAAGPPTSPWGRPGPTGGKPDHRLHRHTVSSGATCPRAPVQVSGIPAPRTSIVITGLTPGSSYTFKVAATNNVGTVPQSAAASRRRHRRRRHRARPRPPNVVGGAGQHDGQRVVDLRPSTGGSTITSYTVDRLSRRARTGRGAQVSATVTGSPPGHVADRQRADQRHRPTRFFGGGNQCRGPEPALGSGRGAVTPGHAALGHPPMLVATGRAWRPPTIFVDRCRQWPAGPITSYTITPYVGTAAQCRRRITGSPPAHDGHPRPLQWDHLHLHRLRRQRGWAQGPASAQSNARDPPPGGRLPGIALRASPATGPPTLRPRCPWTAPADGGEPNHRLHDHAAFIRLDRAGGHDGDRLASRDGVGPS